MVTYRDLFAVFLLGASTVTAQNVDAHPGGTKSDGCHAGSVPPHCHWSISRSAPSGTIIDLDCKDFTSQEAAQQVYESYLPNDVHGLDADNDGLACEWNPPAETS